MTVRDVLVLGCGRSGTSLVAGLFARTHEMGSRLLAPDPANPKGFFEDRAVNAANERLLAPYDAASSPGRRPLREGERWLAVLPPGTVPEQAADLPHDPPGLTSPWCRKDPRLCHTLPAWTASSAQAAAAAVVVVFREPGRTAASLLAHCADGDLGLAPSGALAVWVAAYRSVLAQRRPDWLFVHYDDVLSGTALPAVEDVVGTALDRDVPDAALRRSPDGPPAGAQAQVLYEELCRLSPARPPAARR